MKKTKFALLLAVLAIVLSSVIALSACAAQPDEIPAVELAALTDDSPQMATDSDIRVMSANVLVHIKSWGGEPVVSRANRFAKTVQHYKPDVIGAQEFDNEWYSKLMPAIKNDGYVIIKEKYSLFVENRSPIIYNSNTLDLVDHGIVKFSEGDDNGCRVVSWAVFDTKDSKRFAVTSTHLDLIRSGKEEEELNIMKKQVDELFAKVDEIVAKYNCPVFMCGDYNCMEERDEYLKTEYYGAVDKVSAASEVYNKVAAKYTDIKYIEGIERHDIGGGILPEGAWNSPTWDHIFMSGNATSKAFRILSSIYFQRYEDRNSRISDHLFIFADIELK